MGDLKKLYKTDEVKETNGTWENLGDGIQVLVARWGNKNFNRVMEGMMKPHQHSLRNNNLPDDVASEIISKVMAKTILLGWEGIEEDSVTVVYSQKEALRLLTEYKDFKGRIQGIAQSMEIFKTQEDEETEKN